jgi:hypothetical protein
LGIRFDGREVSTLTSKPVLYELRIHPQPSDTLGAVSRVIEKVLGSSFELIQTFDYKFMQWGLNYFGIRVIPDLG